MHFRFSGEKGVLFKVGEIKNIQGGDYQDNAVLTFQFNSRLPVLTIVHTSQNVLTTKMEIGRL